MFYVAGLVGLSLSYAFTLTGAQIFWTRWFSNLSNHIISVERIKQFINVPAEPPAVVDHNRPPSSWPSKGKIDLQGLEVMFHPCLLFHFYFSMLSPILLVRTRHKFSI